MNTVKIELLSNVSHSKGWGRYSLVNPETKTPIQTSRNGNQWMSADMREVDAEGPMLLTVQVMLRVGKGRTAREEIAKIEVPLVAVAGECVEIEHRPGSQGIVLRVTGACRAAVNTLPAV
jgi:hypothetical protein